MDTLTLILLIAAVVFLALAGFGYSHRRTGRIRWEWLGIACFVATFLVDKLATF